MIRGAASVIAALALGGCSLLFDPDGLMNGTEIDAGSRDGASASDARETDSPGDDASRVDAPLTDGGRACAESCSLASTSAPSWAGCSASREPSFGPSTPPGIPYEGTARVSLALDPSAEGPRANIGFVNGGAMPVPAVYRVTLDGGGSAAGLTLHDAPWASARPPEGVRGIALRTVPSGIAYSLVGNAGPDASGIWVGVLGEMDGTMTNLSGPGGRQEGPLAISSAPARYYWNEMMPTRLVGSLPVESLASDGFRRLTGDLPALPGGIAAAADGMTVVESADEERLQLWAGNGLSAEVSGVPDTLCVDSREPVDPAIAAIGPGEYAVAWVTGTMVFMTRVACTTDGTTTDCCDGGSNGIDFGSPLLQIALREMPGGGFVLGVATETETHVGFYGDDLTQTGPAPLIIDVPSQVGFALDVFDEGARIYVGLVQVDDSPAMLQITPIIVCP